MKYQIRNIPLLKRILWADFLLGGFTALIGLLFYPLLTCFLGLPVELIVIIAVVTMVYALVALSLAVQSPPSILMLRGLVYANWGWTVVSVALVIFFIHNTTPWGAAFLILQVVVVGMLAYLEERHILHHQQNV